MLNLNSGHRVKGDRVMKVRNLTSRRLTLRSADGDSVLLTPSSTLTIDQKFDWQINPQEVRVLREDVIVGIEGNDPSIPVPGVPISAHKGEVKTSSASLQTSRGNSSRVTRSSTIRAKI